MCKRPKPEENLILLGAGDGLKKLTSEEFKYVQPFFLVVRVWLRQQLYLLHSHKQMVDYICENVIGNLWELGHFICMVSPFRPKLKQLKLYLLFTCTFIEVMKKAQSLKHYCMNVLFQNAMLFSLFTTIRKNF